MSQPQICLSATLKPVKEPRMYWKLGQTFSQTNKYRINIIGFGSKNVINEENIIFHPLGLHRKSLFFRWRSAWKTYRIWLQVKPEYLIVCSPDLLWFSLPIRIFYGSKIIYDIQENYRLNIKAQHHHPILKKWFLIGFLWFTERISQAWIERCILAEKVYKDQLRFLRKPYIVLENKFPEQLLSENTKKPSTNQVKLVYTGTISNEYGTDLAIKLFHKLVKAKDTIELTIIGYCADNKYAEYLVKLSANNPSITLMIKNEPIDYQLIVDYIRQADYGLVTYRSNKSFEDKVPTKYFEYAANQVPILFHTESPSFPEIEQNVGLRFDFEEFDPNEFIQKLNSNVFYTEAINQESLVWGAEYQERLIKFINS